MITLRRVVDPRPGLELRLPYRPGNREALRGTLGPGVPLKWNRERRCWCFATKHLHTIVQDLTAAGETVRVEIETKGRYAGAEKCDARCRDARGPYCECACAGRWHGAFFWPKHWIEIDTAETTIGIEQKRVLRVYEVRPERP